MTTTQPSLDEQILDWWKHNIPFVTLGQKWEKHAQESMRTFIRSQQKELLERVRKEALGPNPNQYSTCMDCNEALTLWKKQRKALDAIEREL